MMRKTLLGALTAVGMVVWAAAASATPGLMELAVRSGFWSNQFPDTTIMLQHLYYNTYDQVWDDSSDKVDVAKTKITANFTRLIRPWHFGAQKEYQFILEGILPLANVSFEKQGTNAAGHVSGMLDPMLYVAQGWNNAAKTTHVQAALVVRAPFGDTELTNNAWAYQPILAVQQHFGSMFSIDGSVSYQIETDNLDGSESRGKSYLEVNVIPSVNLGGGWDAFLQGDYTKYAESKTAGKGNSDDGYNTCLALGVNNWFRPNMQLGLKVEKDLSGKNTPASQGFNLRYLWIF
jgi:hypothetical protein